MQGMPSEKLPPVAKIKMATEPQSRFAFPFAVFVFALLAMPLGLSNHRTGKTSGFTISIAILLVYYVLLSFLRTLAEKGGISPSLAVWLPNILFFLLGLALFSLASKEMTLMEGVRSLLGKRRSV